MNLLLLTTYQRRAVIIIYDAICILLSFYLAYVLRYDSLLTYDFDSPYFFQELSLTFFIQLSTLLLMGVHRGLWRFASTKDLVLIMKSVSLAITASLIGIFVYSRLEFTPRSVVLIDAILLVILLSGGRFFYRMIKQSSNVTHSENALLIGAGVAGEQLIREFAKNPTEIEYNISCILDDDTKKHGRTIHGIKISGNIDSLPEKVKRHDASTILIAIPTADNRTIRKIYDLAKSVGVKVNTLPPIVDLLSGKVSFKQMREVQVEDLMGRNMANLDLDTIAHSHKNKVVLITGAGGSIGSELCRQILHYEPKVLVMVDNSEYNIYKMGEEFLSKDTPTMLIYKTESVYETEPMDIIFKKYQPHIVYHAAAYKHVPLMEVNPLAAIKTNILGTNTIAKLAINYNVEKFILVSTDKAVNPTNVMGTTKRIAEMTCEYYQTKGQTIFSMVRFGNVLGSSGSVIPKFKKQILEGGPVTVTHPDITRFFMAIPEAAQLVIQAGCLATGGEIFVLNMGTPVKIVDLAKELITLSGYEVGTEIKIEFTGLRPGEKLFEELLSDDESTLPTAHQMVRVAKTRSLPENFLSQFEKILNLQASTSKNDAKSYLHSLVQEYTPQFDASAQTVRSLS